MLHLHQELYGDAFADIVTMDKGAVAEIQAKLEERQRRQLFKMDARRDALHKRAQQLADEQVTKPMMRAVLENPEPLSPTTSLPPPGAPSGDAFGDAAVVRSPSPTVAGWSSMPPDGAAAGGRGRGGVGRARGQLPRGAASLTAASGASAIRDRTADHTRSVRAPAGMRGAAVAAADDESQYGFARL